MGTFKSMAAPCALLCVLLLGVRLTQGSTLASFETTLGTIELELYDDDKPITVSNFVKYVTSGEYTNSFIQRWEPNFVIQGGGWRVTNTPSGKQLEQLFPIPFGQIRNEYSVGRTFSNVYGTIAMARQPGIVNSASSQWFISLKDNSFLDAVDEGFTVFGRVTAGTNVLNRFIPPPPTNGIYRVNVGGGLNTLPALTASPTFDDLIYVRYRLRRDMNLTITPTRPGQRRLSWNSVAGVTNRLEFRSTTTTNNWTTFTNIIGSGSTYSLIDSSAEHDRLYRVAVVY